MAKKWPKLLMSGQNLSTCIHFKIFSLSNREDGYVPLETETFTTIVLHTRFALKEINFKKEI